MKIKHSKSYYVYQVFNTIILTLVTLSCIFPILHVFAMSLSDSTAAMAGRVTFFPVDFSLAAYEYLIKKKDFFHSVAISGGRVVVGTAFNMILIVLTAYPLARPTSQFRGRTAYMIYFAITMFLGGGLIPTYMVIKNLHLSDVNVTGGTISIIGVDGDISASQRIGYTMISNNPNPVSMSYSVKSGNPTVTVTDMLLCTFADYQANKTLLDSIKYFDGDTMPLA